MTYLAPRQGRFAIIVLLSLCLHILFFVVSSNESLKAHNEQAAAQLSNRLADEIRLPLAINDTVGLAVIARRYESDPVVAYIGIYNAEGGLLVPVGRDIDTQGIAYDIHEGESLLGRMTVKTVPISRATLLAEHWLFLLATLMIHAMLWMVYGYVARPDQKLIDEIAQDVRGQLLAQELLGNQDQTAIADKPKVASVSDFLRSKLNPVEQDNQSQASPNKADASIAKAQIDSAQATSNKSSESDRLVVQLAFVDRYDALSVLTADRAAVYFTLCDQLLEQALAVLKTHPSFAGIGFDNLQKFDTKGASFCLVKLQPTAKLAMAAAFVTKLLPFIYQVIYERHRTLQLFALPIKVISSDELRKPLAYKILHKYNHPSSVLFAHDELVKISSHINLTPLVEADGSEAACRVLGAVNEVIAKQMVGLRQTILLKAKPEM